ncbi:MAG: hypothetical protein MMC23_008732 [Stictis urceolatum]|nr:hypothetical protein [Stictis urceolata]
MSLKRIALIAGSTRQPRLNPYITSHVDSIIKALPKNEFGNTQVDTIDLVDHPLPLFDEPIIPAMLPAADPTPHYTHAHSRAWSKLIASYDAFIFVTPQYNWSVPAALKNSIDYLVHEWKGKPAGIISYGGHGGGKGAAHLKDILTGVGMKVIEERVELTISFGLLDGWNGEAGEERRGAWRKEGAEEKVGGLWKEITGALAEKEVKPVKEGKPAAEEAFEKNI